MDPGLAWHHTSYPKRKIKQLFRTVELSREKPSFPN